MPYLNQQALPMTAVQQPGHELSRSEKKEIKKQTKAQNKALKQARKNGTLIGGEYLAPVAPREEFFMGHPVINEIQKPGLASGYGIPEHGLQGSPMARSGSPYANTYNASSLGGQSYVPTTGTTCTMGTGSTYTTGSQCTSGSPRVVYESAMPSTTYTTGHSLGGTNYVNEQYTTQSHVIQQQPTVVYQQQPIVHQQPMVQQQTVPHAHYAKPVQVQGYYDGMMLEQPHEKAGGFFAPFTGSFTNHGAGTTGGLQGQGKANFTNTIASALPGTQGGYGQGLPTTGAHNPLLNAPNLTYPVALEAERMTGFGSNKHVGLHPPGAKLSRKEKKALKNGTLNNNPEYNNAAIY